MKYQYSHKDGEGKFLLLIGESDFHRRYLPEKKDTKFYTIVWNRGDKQTVVIDEVNYTFGKGCLLPIMMGQSFRFEKPDVLIAWQFNREFYCVVDHDVEVGCVGFVFYGTSPTMFVNLNTEDVLMLERLLVVFEEEFESDDGIKGEMLRMLLVRLIIKTTRLAKLQYLAVAEVDEDKFKLVRKYNLLVEQHFRKEHQVQFYAGLLHKSPKTISNTFLLYNNKTPQQIIQDRIVSEAKRLLYYTDKPVKEIADALGFSDSAHFSRFYKNCAGQNPSEARNAVLKRTRE